jgi:hypothetical protein
MATTLTALYDLAVSPLTFDFAYAIVQAEVERRRRGCDHIAFHIRLKATARITRDPLDDDQWRLHHVLAPLSQLLPRPSDLYIGPKPVKAPEVLSRAHGLHWLSDVLALAEAGEEVQVFAAHPRVKENVERRLRDIVPGRRLITITLREARYQQPRNSNLAAWASLARSLSAKGYAIAVLRDHDHVSEPLPGDWGTAVALPEAVWNLHWRLALYELAWLNLSVNNGPAFLAILDPHTRFLIFKMLGDTPETSPQHCRRLGFEPGERLRFMKSHQRLVWDIDEAGVLHERVFETLSDLGGNRSTAAPLRPPAESVGTPARPDYRGGLPAPEQIGRITSGRVRPAAIERAAMPHRSTARQIGSVAECLVTAARRDYRAGLPAADHLERVPPGPVRTGVAVERAAMLLDEDRVFEAATALSEAPAGPARSALAVAIAHAQPDPKIIEALTPLMSGAETPDWEAALRRAAMRPPVGPAALPPRISPEPSILVQEVDGSCPPEEALWCIAAAEQNRRKRGCDLLHLIVMRGDENWVAAAALFPAIAAFTLCPAGLARSTAASDYKIDPLIDCQPALATVPVRAKTQFKSWLLAQGFGNSHYAVFAPTAGEDAYLWARAAKAAEADDLRIVYWVSLSPIWPVEMLAALCEGAALRVVTEPLAVAFSELLGVRVTPPLALIGYAPEQRL